MVPALRRWTRGGVAGWSSSCTAAAPPVGHVFRCRGLLAEAVGGPASRQPAPLDLGPVRNGPDARIP